MKPIEYAHFGSPIATSIKHQLMAAVACSDDETALRLRKRLKQQATRKLLQKIAFATQ